MGLLHRRRVAWLLVFAACGIFAPAAPVRARGAPSARDLLRVPLKEVDARTKRALIVGIGQYQKVSPLRCTVNDAARFSQFLLSSWGFNDDGVILMTDDASNENLRPTITNLVEQTELLLKQTSNDSEVVVFLSGHGVRYQDKDYLVPLDGSATRIDRTCICITDLLNSIESKNPRRALFFIDACRDMADGKAIARSKVGEDLKPSPAPQLAALYSCEAGETSREGKPGSFQNGVFTYYLLQGLGGDREAAASDGTVTFDSLTTYVRGKVFSYVQKEYASAQSPRGSATFGGMVLARAFNPETVARKDEANARLQAQSLVQQAFTLMLGARPELAKARAEEALKLDPDNANAHLILGSVYILAKDGKLALQELTLAKKLDPELPGIDDRLKEAAALLDGGPSMLPVADGMQAAQAEERVSKKDYTAAEVLAQVVLFVQKDPSKADQALAYSVLGRVYESRNEYDKALKSFQDALAIQADLRQAVDGVERLRMMTRRVDVAAKVNEALQLVQDGKLLEAELRVSEVLGQDPNNARAHLVLGRVFYAQKQYPKSVEQFQRALSLDSTLADARTGLADANARIAEGRVLVTARQANDALQQNNAADAEAKATQVLDAATQNVPANGLAHFVLGRVNELKGNNPAALQHYQEALRLEPGRNEARLGLERVQRAIGKRDITRLIADSAEALQENKLDEAEAKARQATAQSPESAGAHFVLGQVYSLRNRLDDAIREYLEARRLDASLPDVDAALKLVQEKKARAEAGRLADESYRHFAKAEWADAVSKARQAIELDKSNAQAHAVLGAALLSMNDEKTGSAEIEEAARLNTHLALISVGEGIGLYQQFMKAQKGAIEEWIKSPASPELLDRAVEKFQRALGLNRREITALNNLGAVSALQGILLQQKGKGAEAKARFDLAAQMYRGALDLDGSFPIAHYNLGNIYLQQGDFATAEQSYRKAVELYPKNPRFHAALAGALWLQKRKDDAVAEARQAIRDGWTSDWVYDLMEKEKIRLR